jgi:hypothetical protein
MKLQSTKSLTLESTAEALEAALAATASPPEASPPPTTTEFALAAGQRLVIHRAPGEEFLRLLAPDGEVELSIHFRQSGPVLRFRRPLSIVAPEELVVEGRHLTLRGREGLSLESGRDLDIRAAGDLISRARVQTLIAELGNVNVKANDDVKLNGERIKMNCE